MNTKHTHRRHRFTLVELLVVIAIISVLASLLLPALSKARGRAQSTLCLSNHKQIVMGATLYADEHFGWLPTSPRWSTGWQVKIAPYIGEFVPNMHSQANRPTAPDKYYAIYRCPSNFGKPNAGYWGSSYGYNIPLTTQTDGGSNLTGQTGIYRFVRRLDAIKQPANTVLTGDCYAIHIGGFGYFTTGVMSTDPAYSRSHTGMSVNLSFCDGSSQNLTVNSRNDLQLGVSQWSTITGWTYP